MSHPFVPHHVFPRPVFRPFIPFGVIASPVVVYAPPPVYYGAPPYYDPPVTYGPPPGGTVSVTPSPMPTVVQYPHGRYELRGDGVTTPYTWVWIPNPPPPPPPAAPPTVTPPPAAYPAPARHPELYRWLDDAGVAHWTDRLDAVPERYRAGARSTPG